MKRFILALIFGLALSATVSAFAGELQSAPPLVHSPAASLLAKPVTLRGTLGDQKIQVYLHLKEQIDEGVEGDYFIFGRSHKILLAGEVDNNTVSLEESENGTDISGQWDGKIDGNILHGTWISADNTVTKPFEVTVIATDATAEKKSNNAAKHRKTVAGAHAVSTPNSLAK